MKHEDKGISIILPAYNEEENIGHAVNDIIHYFSGTDNKYEIIIVNDGSTDMTGTLADRIKSRYCSGIY